jgi:hypothetical protein
MFDASQKPTGTAYTTTVALLVIAFVFSPAALVVSRPFGYLSLSFAVALSTLCVILAWVNWSRWSQLTIPSIVTKDEQAK